MAKIINVEMTAAGYKVSYDTGSTRTYKEAPKSVMAYLESTQKEAQEIPVAQEPVSVPAVRPMESIHSEDVPASLQTAHDAPSPVALEESTQCKAQMIHTAQKTVTVPAVSPARSTQTEEPKTPALPVTVPTAAVGMIWILIDKASALWFALSTWLLIWYDRLIIRAPEVWEGAKARAISAHRRACKLVPAVTWGILQVAGLPVCIALLGAAMARSAARMAREGWIWREDLIKEAA